MLRKMILPLPLLASFLHSRLLQVSKSIAHRFLSLLGNVQVYNAVCYDVVLEVIVAIKKKKIEPSVILYVFQVICSCFNFCSSYTSEYHHLSYSFSFILYFRPV